MLCFNKSAVIATIIFLCLASRVAALPHVWSKSFGDAVNQYAPNVATDNLGYTLVAGTFEGGIELGGLGFWSAGGTDLYLAKFDGGGNHIWSDRYGDSSSDWVYGIAVDGSNNVIIAGHFHGTVTFGPGPLASAGQGDIFLAKFDPQGNHLWSHRFGDSWDQSAYDVAVDDAGNILLTGEFNGSVNFGGGALASHMDFPDVFVVKFDPSGNHLWSQDYGDLTHHQVSNRVSVDGAGNVVVAGWYEGSINFGGGVLPAGQPGQPDMFLVQLSPSGTHNWSHGFAATSWEMCQDVAIDNLDAVIITGEFAGTLDLGDGPLANAGGKDIFLARFYQNGNHDWSVRFGTAGVEEAYGVAANSVGNIFITGRFNDAVNFGGGYLSTAGNYDLYLAQFDLDANHIWSQSFGGSVNQQGHDLATWEDSDLILSGQFQGSLNLGGNTLVCAGGTDAFIANFGDPGGPGVTSGGYTVTEYEPPYMYVTVTLQNAGPGNVAAVAATMSEDISWLRVMDPDCYYGDIPEGGSNDGAVGDTYQFYFTSGYPGGVFDVQLEVTCQDAFGNPHMYLFDLAISPTATGVTMGDKPDSTLQLLYNYPNPFNPTTQISFDLRQGGKTNLSIYDMAGRVVRTLWSGVLPAGHHFYRWNGVTDTGQPVPSGVYFCRLYGDRSDLTCRVVLVR